MISSIDHYLELLRKALSGSDRALIQDAVADAYEHLSTALGPDSDDVDAADHVERLEAAVADFGMPEEVAAAYREADRRAPVSMPEDRMSSPGARGFFAVYADLRTWGAVLYLTLSLWLGFGYLMWIIFGATLSIVFSIFIIGVPLALSFLLSIRGIALLEGRLIEALLGQRMPRRRVFFPRQMRWLDQIRALINDRHTWLTLLYSSTLWLVGLVYFFLVMIPGVIGLALIALPVLQEWLDRAVLVLGNEPVLVPRILYPLSVIAGFLILTVLLHLVRAVGGAHARLAKMLLVGESTTS